MNKTNGRRAINHILQMMEEDEHINEGFKIFIDDCLSDYLHNKKLSHSLYSLIRFDNYMVDETEIEKAIKEIKEENGKL